MSTLLDTHPLEKILENPQKDFHSVRAMGKDAFLKQGLPSAKAEEYKFTNLTKKLSQNFDSFEIAADFELTEEQVNHAIFEGFDGYRLVFANGYFHDGLSSKIEGLTISKLEESSLPLGSIAKAEKDPFAALNQASFEGGAQIALAKNTQIDKPILILNFINPSNGNLIQPRIWFETGDFGEATFIEQQIQLEAGDYFLNEVKEIKGGRNSHIHWYRIQNEGKDAISMSNIETDIQQDATFTSVNISLSGHMVRNNLSLNLLGSNSEGNMYGLYLTNGNTHVDNHTNVDHTIPHAESNELYKGVLTDNSRGVFNGKIFVRQDAQKTNAFQQNNNILLSENATVNTKPQLEIWADDVKCSHGCTTGQLDEEALFYLQARGIGKDKAKGLLLYAFAGEVLENIKDDSFKAYCINLIQERLGTNLS
ncbi:Fe-S cluster assembly protein SufD [Algoriphagus sediminis]|uniref:Fe-S cluster assembly protein SufD n=1 Tax=Algoriphagus sediminis TaxID=3057113 RepID=A0ABT7YE52_9BACT|nr:Fe-S cluster assembly protein SufD [Algoriphagus sediminis]MDN3204778.1 Fe-S cluster assembly protein SufD [Algoriphagus sediminis]